jgi:hypothetical protein
LVDFNNNLIVEAGSKVFLPPRPDASVGTPLLEKGGEMFDIKYLSFLLLDKEEYPDSKRQGEEVTFETASIILYNSSFYGSQYQHPIRALLFVITKH